MLLECYDHGSSLSFNTPQKCFIRRRCLIDCVMNEVDVRAEFWEGAGWCSCMLAHNSLGLEFRCSSGSIGYKTYLPLKIDAHIIPGMICHFIAYREMVVKSPYRGCKTCGAHPGMSCHSGKGGFGQWTWGCGISPA